MPEENNGEKVVLGSNRAGPRMMAFKPEGERGPTVYRDMAGISPEHLHRIQRLPDREKLTGRAEPSIKAGRPNPRSDAADQSMPMPDIVAKVFSQDALRFISETLFQTALRIDPELTAHGGKKSTFTTLGDSVPALLNPFQHGDVQFSEFDDPLARRFPRRGGGDLFPPEEKKTSTKDLPESIRNKIKADAKAALEALDRKVAKPPSPFDDGILTDPPLPIVYPPSPYGPGEPMGPPTPVRTNDDPFARFEEEQRSLEERDELRRIRQALKDKMQPWGPTYKLPSLTDPFLPGQHEPHLRPLPGVRSGADILGPWPIPGLPGLKGGLWGGERLGGSGVVGGAYIDLLEWLRIYFGGSLGPESDFPGFEIGIHFGW